MEKPAYKSSRSYISLVFMLSLTLANSTRRPLVQVESRDRNETIISVHHQAHLDYGLSYPMTYEFNIPANGSDYHANVRFRSDQEWTEMLEKTSEDFFNGIEVVRFDHDADKAYVSVGFSSFSDSIYIMFTNAEGTPISAIFQQTTTYYDDRDAAVTATADDWADWCNEKFIQTCHIFRSHNLWLSTAIVTHGVGEDTWADIQAQIDSGYVEPVSHSRTHPYVPYEDLEGEVFGCKQDLIDNLDLPDHNRYGDNEYIYAWVAPYGEYDDDIDSMVSVSKYLTTRLYYPDDHGFGTWDNDLNKYDPVGVSREVGPLWVGTTDTVDLNNTFDEVLSSGGVYHVMCHPNVIEWDQDYPWAHLEHISNRRNVWYVGFGHLYAYHFLQSEYPSLDLKVAGSVKMVPTSFKLYQNYPNPFNSRTKIRFYSEYNNSISLNIIDLNGNIIKNIINNNVLMGYHTFDWDGTNDIGVPVSAGIYFVSIRSNDGIHTRKMVLLK